MRINYDARAKAGFTEQNPIWRFFDRRGLMVLTILIHVAFVFGMTLLSVLTGSGLILGLLAGALFVDYAADSLTWKSFEQAPSYTSCLRCGELIPRRFVKCPNCEKLQ